jgi:cytochrome c oxidase cbb3-type subunit 1
MATTDSRTHTSTQLDQSCRVPVLYMLASSVAWLGVALVLALVTGLQLRYPNLLNPTFLNEWTNVRLGWFDWDTSWLNYGRLRPVFEYAAIYGWAAQGSFALIIWLMVRLCQTPLRNPMLVMGASLLWNGGLTLAAIFVLAGMGGSLPGLDFPGGLWLVMLAAQLLIMAVAYQLFVSRKAAAVYLSQFYLLAAVTWLPLVFVTANLLVRCAGHGGALVPYAQSWFSVLIIALFFVPAGLGALYYFVPKITGQPIFAYKSAFSAFWLYALLAPFTGAYKLVGGLFPAWISTLSMTAGILLAIPLALIGVTLLIPVSRSEEHPSQSISLRFALLGLVCLFCYFGFEVLQGIRPFGQMVQFTLFQTGHQVLAYYGFFSMILYAGVYHIVPRLVGLEWSRPNSIQLQFLFSAYAAVFWSIALMAAGAAQGMVLGVSMAKIPDVVVVEAVRPYLFGQTVALLLIALSTLGLFDMIRAALFKYWDLRGVETFREALFEEVKD